MWIRFKDRTPPSAGNWDDLGITNIIFAQQVTSKFICRKRYQEFVYHFPDEVIVGQLAQILRESNYELKPVLETLLLSAHFSDDTTIGSKIKSPIDHVAYAKIYPAPWDAVSLVRSMGTCLTAFFVNAEREERFLSVVLEGGDHRPGLRFRPPPLLLESKQRKNLKERGSCLGLETTNRERGLYQTSIRAPLFAKEDFDFGLSPALLLRAG